MDNILNKIIAIEKSNGDTFFSFEIDQNGNIVKISGASIADKTMDYVFNTDKELVRIQADVIKNGKEYE